MPRVPLARRIAPAILHLPPVLPAVALAVLAAAVPAGLAAQGVGSPGAGHEAPQERTGSPLDRPDTDHEGLVVTLNLPAHEVEVWRDGERIRRYPAAIGLPAYATPTGAFRIDRVVWNPWWNPPPSEWARNEERTPPGPRNPMGRAKLRFEGLLYVHGTASPSDLGREVSHGCVRISNEDVLDLARLLALESGALDEEEIDRLERSPSATREVSLGEGIPLRIRYRVAETVDGEVRTYEDVYRYGITEDERQWMRRSGSRNEEEAGADTGSSLETEPGTDPPEPEDRWQPRR